MDLINILKVIYQKKDISDINSYPYPYIVLKWLSMNPTLNKEVSYLNKYAFILDEEQFFKLCYCLIPKQSFRFYKYIKTKKEIEHLYNPLIARFRARFKMADNDYSAIDNILITNIENNMLEWLKMGGIPEKQYKKFGVAIPKTIKKDNISTTLRTNYTTGNTQILNNKKIRKLTPKECFRLMGFLEDQINLEGISNSQLYKLAGNGWEINVVSKIFKRLI